MKLPKKAILDGDIILYKAAHTADVEGIDTLEECIRHIVRSWVPEGCSEYILALSCPRSENFRKDFWPKYKSNRDSLHTPDCLYDCREYIIDSYDYYSEDRIEADDIMGIKAGTNICVTIDKDLRSVPGWHWNPYKENAPVKINKRNADRFFFKQWMMGDSTDGIPGLWKIGPKKADKMLDEWKKKDWTENIIALYEENGNCDKYDMSPEEYYMAMARSVRILRKGDYNFNTKEIKLWSPIVGHSGKES